MKAKDLDILLFLKIKRGEYIKVIACTGSKNQGNNIKKQVVTFMTTFMKSVIIT